MGEDGSRWGEPLASTGVETFGRQPSVLREEPQSDWDMPIDDGWKGSDQHRVDIDDSEALPTTEVKPSTVFDYHDEKRDAEVAAASDAAKKDEELEALASQPVEANAEQDVQVGDIETRVKEITEKTAAELEHIHALKEHNAEHMKELDEQLEKVKEEDARLEEQEIRLSEILAGMDQAVKKAAAELESMQTTAPEALGEEAA